MSKATLKIFSPDQGFAGMPELFRAITNTETTSAKFTLVSAITSMLESRINTFLTSSGYPSRDLRLLNWFTEWSIEEFKKNRIKNILSALPNRNFIVIFDNSDPSVQMADWIAQNYPKKIFPVYLRQTLFKKSLPNHVPFITAMDIAWSEYGLERLSLMELEKVAQAILAENDPEKIIPKYAYCPKDYSACSGDHGVSPSVCTKVTGKIKALCSAR